MADFMTSYYLWFKSAHILAFIAWMAGLFYLPRLFVYHVEAAAGDTERSALFATMERRLLRAIMNPAMIATWIFGGMMLSIPGLVDWSSIWPWTKAAAVIAMTAFHMWCSKQRRLLAAGDMSTPGRRYRIMNEVPTILLVVIVISVVVRPF